jgi:hypothetical protein
MDRPSDQRSLMQLGRHAEGSARMHDACSGSPVRSVHEARGSIVK